jgi:hypothetical protein
MTRHRWSDKTVISANKSERECLNGCGRVCPRCPRYPQVQVAQ